MLQSRRDETSVSHLRLWSESGRRVDIGFILEENISSHWNCFWVIETGVKYSAISVIVYVYFCSRNNECSDSADSR